MLEKNIASSGCISCKRVIVPPREVCPYCGNAAGPMEKMDLPNRGVVQSYTTLQLPPEGFTAPLSMALVELDHGALILCLASEKTKVPVNIGDQVEIEVDSEDRFYYRTIG